MRPAPLSALTLVAGLALGGSALAQSTGAPAGRDPATAPGGAEGLAGPRNEMNAVRDGDAVPVPPRAGGIENEAPQPGERMPPPPRN